MKSSPIYNIINNPSRKSDCSFGSFNGYHQIIRVGTSASNSHKLAEIEVRRNVDSSGEASFTMFVDGVAVKRGKLNGKEFELIQ